MANFSPNLDARVEKVLSLLVMSLLLAACATQPLVPYSTAMDPLAEMPIGNGGASVLKEFKRLLNWQNPQE